MLRRIARLTLALSLILTASAAGRTALDRYVEAHDANFKYEAVKTISGAGYTATVLDMISQSWRSPQEVNRTLWQHWVTIVRPEKVTSTSGFLFITGGANGGQPPERPDPMLTRIATEAGIVVAELRMVPNQPLTFVGDTMKQRREDETIAYTWDKHLRGGDEQWPLRLPMTKSAVRAMDAVTAFSKTTAGGGVTVDKFIVSGGSKRGWTTWTTAAVDKRVVAIAPLVIDLLNIEPSFIHHWRAYGFWAPAIQDYIDMRIMDWSGTPQYRALMKIEEPYEYRDRLTMPKMIINATGDEFFLPDSSQFYFDDLKGEKHLRYVPNTGHSLRGTDVGDTLLAFTQSIVGGKPRPRFSFKMEKDGVIRVKATDRPEEVKLWQATNPNARDFRIKTSGATYASSPLTDQGGGVFIGSVPKPEKGWTAFFVELTYIGPAKTPLKLTTGVKVVPDVYPFEAPKLNPPLSNGR